MCVNERKAGLMMNLQWVKVVKVEEFKYLLQYIHLYVYKIYSAIYNTSRKGKGKGSFA